MDRLSNSTANSLECLKRALCSPWLLPMLLFILLLQPFSPRVAKGELRVWTDDAGVLHMSNVPEGGRESKSAAGEARQSKKKRVNTAAKAPASKPAPAPAPTAAQITEPTKTGQKLTDINQMHIASEEDFQSPSPAPKISKASKAGQFSHMVSLASKTYSLPVELIYAVMKVESNFNPKAVSRVGAQGLMQLMPATAAYLGVEDSFNPTQNIMGGTRYLRELANRFSGDIVLVLAAYNAGQGAVDRSMGVPYDDTEWYVRHVLKYFQQYQEKGLP